MRKWLLYTASHAPSCCVGLVVVMDHNYSSPTAKIIRERRSIEAKLLRDKLRSKTKVHIGEMFSRWRELREKLGLDRDSAVAWVLIDSFEKMVIKEEKDEMFCKSVGTDLSMLDIDDFITEISQLKKKVALLETKLRLRGDEGLMREDVDVVCCESSTQDSELSLTLLCYTESKHTDAQDTTVCDSNQDLQDDESTDQTSTESLDSVCNAGEQQQMLQMCSVKPIDRGNQTEIKMEPSEIEIEPTEEEHYTDDEDDDDDEEDDDDYNDDDDDDDFIPSDMKSESSSGEETTSTSQKPLYSVERPYQCTECGKCLSNKYNLDVHKTTHTGEKPYECPHCEKRFSCSFKQKKHLRVHTNERPYQCIHCGKTFRFKETLRKHEITHSERSHQCSYCDKRFYHKMDLIIHERTHTGERPYLCCDCGKSFSSPTAFSFHKRVHTGEKPHQCSFCGKSFSKCSNLKTHLRIHTGEKPYKCTECGEGFNQAVLLRIHQRVHTGEKPYRCSICGERFANVGPFKTHQKKHAEEQTDQ
nr:zinc finger protein 771-like isoform X2 [Misgurnus anguillicaudatus]